MLKGVIRCTAEGSSRHSRVSALNVIVVAVYLGEGLFENRSPNGIIETDFGENSIVSAILVIRHWNVIVDDDSMRNTKSIEIHSVDTVRAHFVVLVDKDALDAAWNF